MSSTKVVTPGTASAPAQRPIATPRMVIGSSASHIKARLASQAVAGARTPPTTKPATKTRIKAGSTTTMITADLASRKICAGRAVMFAGTSPTAVPAPAGHHRSSPRPATRTRPLRP